MKALLFVLGLIGLSISPLQNDPAEASAAGTSTYIKVPSPEMDFPIRQALVWTPPAKFGKASDLPVVYFLHGWPGSPSAISTAFISPLNSSFGAGAKPFVAVFPDGNSTTHLDSEWADSSDGAAMVETWIINNLIPAVEHDRLRTNTERAIAGFSMGGYGATIIALHHPDIFSQVVSMSGYFQVDDLTGAFTDLNKVNFQDPSKFLNISRKLRWYLTEGTRENDNLVSGQAASWSKKLIKAGASVRVRYLTGGHYYSVAATTIPDLTSWLKWNTSGSSYPYNGISNQGSSNESSTQTLNQH